LLSREAARPGAPTNPGERTAERTVGLLWLLTRFEFRSSWLLFQRELRELLVSRALWAMVLISGLLVGFSFLQAVQLYSGSSLNAQRLPQLAASLSPLDGIVIPTFGGVYLMNTFLLPFVAIRLIGNEKQTGGLKLLLQLPVGVNRLVGIKLAALAVGWSIALVPTLSALVIWSTLLGGHLYLPEVASVLLGHALYAFVIVGFAFMAASLTESSATAAIVTLSFTLGAWILEFAAGSGGGLVKAIAAFSLSPALRGLERGLLGSPTAVTLFVLGLAFLALTVVWLPPGTARRQKLARSAIVLAISAQALLLVIQLPMFVDVSEDRRNSFNPADERALRRMNRELKVDVNLAANDSRLRDLDRQVLSKLQRTVPQVTINYAETSASGLLGGTSGANYGLVTFTYGGRQGSTRATSAREVLPLIHKLAGQQVVPERTAVYPGYPLVTSASAAAVWFYVVIPLLALGGWWLNQRPPRSVEYAGPDPEARRFAWRDWFAAGPSRWIALGVGAVLVLQLVPYGRDHANISVDRPVAALDQLCQTLASSPESVMPLGTFRNQLASLVPVLDGAVVSANPRAAYAQFASGFDGSATEIAQLYPGRCPRLLANRATIESALLATAPDVATVDPALRGLRAGVASMIDDLDIRIRQDSPDDFVGEQPTETTSPSVTGAPAWTSPRAAELATRACAGCHSNQPSWPWYTNVAPLSWFVQHQVDAGRAALNFSEWDRPQPGAARAVESVQSGSMPPLLARAVDDRSALTDAERTELLLGMQGTFGGRTTTVTIGPSAPSMINPLLFIALGAAIILIALGYPWVRRQSWQF
jgi:ABC-type transport system involved in multi-copper enzyme maturation permease subunit